MTYWLVDTFCMSKEVAANVKQNIACRTSSHESSWAAAKQTPPSTVTGLASAKSCRKGISGRVVCQFPMNVTCTSIIVIWGSFIATIAAM